MDERIDDAPNQNREEVNAAQREAIAEMQAGLGQPLDEVIAEIRETLGLPCE